MQSSPFACALFGLALSACSRTNLIESPGRTDDAGNAPDPTSAQAMPSVRDASLPDAVVSHANDGRSCRYPGSVQVSSEPSGSGCFAHTPGQVCQVSNGATVLPDGGVSGGTESCTSICGASQYEMTCMNTDAGPDPSLGCTIIPIPTPSCCLYYCCPCVE